jgi:hypothetical protein
MANFNPLFCPTIVMASLPLLSQQFQKGLKPMFTDHFEEGEFIYFKITLE